jgi:hypothetical protein
VARVDGNGIVVERSGWFDADRLRAALDRSPR